MQPGLAARWQRCCALFVPQKKERKERKKDRKPFRLLLRGRQLEHTKAAQVGVCVCVCVRVVCVSCALCFAIEFQFKSNTNTLCGCHLSSDCRNNPSNCVTSSSSSSRGSPDSPDTTVITQNSRDLCSVSGRGCLPVTPARWQPGRVFAGVLLPFPVHMCRSSCPE